MPHLSWAIFRRTRSAKISAPPPGSESSPAAISSRSTCSSVMPYRSAKNAISTAVKHFRWMSGRIRLKPAQQLRVVVERQIGMQAVDDVDFGERLVGALPQLVPRLLERHRVGAGIARLEPRERAEQAARHADVGRLEADVVVVEGAAAVPLLALAIGQPADGQQIGASNSRTPSSSVEALAGVELVGDVEEAGGGEASVHRVIG